MTMTATIKLHRSRAPDDNCPHILVIDDDSRIRDLLARYLQEHGFRVTTAVDAASARATMRSLSFDLLILDLDQADNHVAVRPSGTGPKVTFYLFAYDAPAVSADLPAAKAAQAERLAAMEADLKAFSGV